jgi:hypothetical protein
MDAWTAAGLVEFHASQYLTQSFVDMADGCDADEVS